MPSRERELQHTAQLYRYVLQQRDQPVPVAVDAAAKDQYCHADFVPQLCALLRGLSEPERHALMQHALVRQHRELAAWWQAHEEQRALGVRA